MSEHYHRQDTRHSYNNQRVIQYQRQTNRSSYQSNKGSSREGQKYSSHYYREKSNHDNEGYKNRQGKYYDDDKYKTGRDYRQSQRSSHTVGYEHQEYNLNKYSHQYQNKDSYYKGRQYSRDTPSSYRRYQSHYNKTYQSKHEKRSRSRSRNKDQYYGQQGRDYGKSSSGGYDNNKGCNKQSYSNTYSKNDNNKANSNYSFTNNNNKRSQQHNKNIILQKQNYRHESKQYHQHSSLKDDKRIEQSMRNFISIEVKNRQRTPSPKDKKTRKQHSSRSKSRSIEKRSKEKPKRKNNNKKHRSSSSSSHSSSYSSSSSSSSSNRSSSSSSRSSTSSYSQSPESRRYTNKHKQYKDFYHKNSSQQQQRYLTQNYSNRQKYEQKYPSQKRPYEHSKQHYGKFSKGREGRSEREQKDMQVKQTKTLKPIIAQENTVMDLAKSTQQQQDKKQFNHDEKLTKKPQTTPLVIKKTLSHEINNIIIEKTEKQIQPVEVKISEHETITQSIQRQRQYEQKDSYKKYNVGSRFPSEISYQQSYQNQRQFNNYSQYQNHQQQQQQQQQQVPQIIQQPDKSPYQNNTQFPLPSYPNRTYSADNQKMSFGGENDFYKRSFINQNVRRPYVNNYQNYPPKSMLYQSGFPNPPYQRFNQGFNANRSFDKNYYQNRNIQGSQQNLPFNNFNNPQNHFINQTAMPYQPGFPPQIRRVSSQMVGERKGQYFQQSQDNKDNDLNMTQINKLQTGKQDLALIQQVFKRQYELKKISQLTPCSKTLQLIEKARQNLSIPAIKTNFLVLDLFKSMSDFKKQTMNSSLRSILQQDFQNKYNEQKSKVFENLRLLNIDEDEISKQTSPKRVLQQQPQQQVPTQIQQKQPQQLKMDTEHNLNQNPQQNSRPVQFIWKKQQMSQTLRQLKSNIEMMRKASSSLAQMSRKIKVKELTN